MSPIVEPPPYGTRANPDGSVTAFSTLKFEPTTTPLDPLLVKVGDTVTLQGTKAKIEGEVSNTYDDGIGLVLQINHIRFRVTGAEHWTLTDHQPAPEPEPEWEDGQIGDALVHGASVRGFISNDGESFVFSVPGGGYHEAGHGSFDDFVPLVVLDPADVDVDAITLHVRDDEQPGDAHPDDFELTRQDVLAVLDFLGLGAP